MIQYKVKGCVEIAHKHIARALKNRYFRQSAAGGVVFVVTQVGDYGLEKISTVIDDEILKKNNTESTQLLNASKHVINYTRTYVLPSISFTALFQVPAVFTHSKTFSLFIESSKNKDFLYKFLIKTPKLIGKVFALEGLGIYKSIKAGKKVKVEDVVGGLTKEPFVVLCKVLTKGKFIRDMFCNAVGESSNAIYDINIRRAEYQLKKLGLTIVLKSAFKTGHQRYEDVFVDKFGNVNGFYLAGSLFPRSLGNEGLKSGVKNLFAENKTVNKTSEEKIFDYSYLSILLEMIPGGFLFLGVNFIMDLGKKSNICLDFSAYECIKTVFGQCMSVEASFLTHNDPEVIKYCFESSVSICENRKNDKWWAGEYSVCACPVSQIAIMPLPPISEAYNVTLVGMLESSPIGVDSMVPNSF